MKHHLCVAWNWEYDADFMTMLEASCTDKGLSLLQVTTENLDSSLHLLIQNQLAFEAFLDRASEVDRRFLSLVRWAKDNNCHFINEYEKAVQSWDKAAMHEAFMQAGLSVPRTRILPAFEEQPVLFPEVLTTFRDPFTMKPAHGSGGEGVVTNVRSWDEVHRIRQEHPADKYLLQAHIVPREIDQRPAWFRVLFCSGRVFPCWWDPDSHIYARLAKEDLILYSLSPLVDIAEAIARVCGLALFSTEIALTADGEFTIVDYVNDPIDLRLQSKAPDGVPDEVVGDLVGSLVEAVAQRLPSSGSQKEPDE